MGKVMSHRDLKIVGVVNKTSTTFSLTVEMVNYSDLTDRFFAGRIDTGVIYGSPTDIGDVPTAYAHILKTEPTPFRNIFVMHGELIFIDDNPFTKMLAAKDNWGCCRVELIGNKITWSNDVKLGEKIGYVIYNTANNKYLGYVPDEAYELMPLLGENGLRLEWVEGIENAHYYSLIRPSKFLISLLHGFNPKHLRVAKVTVLDGKPTL